MEVVVLCIVSVKGFASLEQFIVNEKAVGYNANVGWHR
jgi:hypothetical protein